MSLKDIEFNNVKLKKKDKVIKKEITIPKDIAVIGMYVNFPHSESLDKTWELIKNKTNCVRKFPKSRKIDTDKYLNFLNLMNDNIKYEDSAFIDDIAGFDYSFFNIPPKEARFMDPNQRLFLENSWNCIEDAGYGGEKIKNTKTGVYLAYKSSLSNLYKNYIGEVEPESLSHAIVGNKPPLVASRISYELNLKGPNLLIDSACSASLVSLHLACQGLRSNDCEMAIVGAVKIILLPVNTSENIGIESSDGRTRAFDNSSDGCGPGEGVASILLKPLNRAEKDKDNIYAVIKGSAVNQDGKPVSIAAPNPKAQSEVITMAWEDANIDPETIKYIETHGTGTKIGDPIEIEGIQKAFEKYTSKKQFCAISSVKSNYGHLDNLAGMAGIIKAILSLKNKEIPPTCNFSYPNSSINFMDSPLYVNTERREWDNTNSPRRCGVSAFGLTGTNSHVVLEEYIETVYKRETDTINILTLSGKTEKSMSLIITNYHRYLLEKSDTLNDICFTANTGREHYRYRTSIIVKNRNDLIDKLLILKTRDLSKEYSDSEISYSICKNSNVEDTNKMADNIIKNIISSDFTNFEQLVQLRDLYSSGVNIKWDKLYANRKLFKVSLPCYPFEKTKCWVETPEKPSSISNILKSINLNQTDNLHGDIIKDLQNVLEKYGYDYNIESKNKNSLEIINVKLSGRDNNQFSKMEGIVSQSWKEILGYESFNINSIYFELGGDSISALRITNLLSRALGIQLNVTDLLKNPTILKLANFIENRFDNKTFNFIPIKEAPEGKYFPLTYAQKRMYNHCLMENTGLSYNMSGTIILEGDVDYKKIEGAFNKLVKKHEILRTKLVLNDNEVVQKIECYNKISLKVKELKNKTLDELASDFIKPFDIIDSQLFRVMIIKIHELKHGILLDMHHLISDGSSTGVLFKDLTNFYYGISNNERYLQYKDFAFFEKNYIKTEKSILEKKVLLSKLQKSNPVIKLPYDYEKKDNSSFKGERIQFLIPEKDKNKIYSFMNDLNITLYTVLSGAYSILMYLYSKQEDFNYGTSVTGRSHADLENIIGMISNFVVIRNKIDINDTVNSFINRHSNIIMDIYANQNYPILKLEDSIKDIDLWENNSLFNTLFVLQNTNNEIFKTEDFSIDYKHYYTNTSKYDMQIQATEKNNIISLVLEYRTELFKRETMNLLTKNYLNIIRILIEDGDTKLADIKLI